ITTNSGLCGGAPFGSAAFLRGIWRALSLYQVEMPVAAAQEDTHLVCFGVAIDQVVLCIVHFHYGFFHGHGFAPLCGLDLVDLTSRRAIGLGFGGRGLLGF